MREEVRSRRLGRDLPPAGQPAARVSHRRNRTTATVDPHARWPVWVRWPQPGCGSWSWPPMRPRWRAAGPGSCCPPLSG